MIERLLAEAQQALERGEKHKMEQRIQQMAQSPDEAVPLMLRALRHRQKVRLYIPILVLQRIGFPKNEPAIPALLRILGDGNHPEGPNAARTLLDMGPDILIPHLLRALLEKGEPYHTPMLTETTWHWDVEGICYLITNKVPVVKEISNEYALRCCPAINMLLLQAESTHVPEEYPDPEILLDVLEKVGTQASYLLPTLITLARNHQESEVGTRAKALIFSFPQKEREPYHLLVQQFSQDV